MSNITNVSSPPNTSRLMQTVGLCFLVALMEGLDLQAAGIAAVGIAQAFTLDKMQMGWIFSAGILGLLPGALFGGMLADRYGRKTMLVSASVMFLLLTFPLFGMLGNPSLLVILMIQIAFGAILAMNDGTLPCFLAEIFPTRVRFSGFAFSFNIANALFGGTAPFIATWLIQMTGNKMAPAWLIVQLLNPKIRGWANYHRHVVSSQTFSYVDHRIWQMLWRWARRRHHNKPRRWVAEKYFGRHGEREWVFGGVGPDGVMCHLLLANQVSIKRHVKVKGDANPYDQSQESYFEARQMARLKENRLWFGKLRLIWARQKHRCPLCGQPFRDNDDWDLHHIVYKTRGGGDEAENLMMLHPNCHRQYHAKTDGDNAGADLE